MTTIAMNGNESDDILRPQTDEKIAREFVETLFGFKVVTIKELDSYVDRNYLVFVEEEHSNPYVDKISEVRYNLKILNTKESLTNRVEAEHAAMEILLQNKINCPVPVRNLQGRYHSLQEISQPPLESRESVDPSSTQHTVRLLTFVPGLMLHNVPCRGRLLLEAGLIIGRIDNVLKDFSHPNLTSFDTIWNPLRVPELKKYLHVIQEEERVKLATDIMDGFSTRVLPNISSYQKGVIHADFNEYNILVNKTQDGYHTITGVIDFGDMIHSYYIFEVAITIMHLMMEAQDMDPLEVGGHVLAGYLTEMQLTSKELEVLSDCVAARFVQILVLGAYSYTLDPGNEYLLEGNGKGWTLVEQLWRVSKEELDSKWKIVM